MVDCVPQPGGGPVRTVITVGELLGRVPVNGGGPVPSSRVDLRVEPRSDRTFTELAAPRRRLLTSASAIFAAGTVAGAAMMLGHTVPGPSALDGGYPAQDVLEQPGLDRTASMPVAFPTPFAPGVISVPLYALSRGVMPTTGGPSSWSARRLAESGGQDELPMLGALGSLGASSAGPRADRGGSGAGRRTPDAGTGPSVNRHSSGVLAGRGGGPAGSAMSSLTTPITPRDATSNPFGTSGAGTPSVPTNSAAANSAPGARAPNGPAPAAGPAAAGPAGPSASAKRTTGPGRHAATPRARTGSSKTQRARGSSASTQAGGSSTRAGQHADGSTKHTTGSSARTSGSAKNTSGSPTKHGSGSSKRDSGSSKRSDGHGSSRAGD